MAAGCNCKKNDRYVSFEGIDCDGKARRLMAHIDAQVAQPGRDNAFWEYFRRKRQGRAGVVPDDLYLIHGNLNQIRDFLESWDDAAGLAMLEELEAECC